MTNIYESWGMGIDPDALEVGKTSDKEPVEKLDDTDLYDPLLGKVPNSNVSDEDLELESLVGDLGISDDYFTDDMAETNTASTTVNTTTSNVNTETTTEQDLNNTKKEQVNTSVPKSEPTTSNVSELLPLVKKAVFIILLPSILIFAVFAFANKGSSDSDSKSTEQQVTVPALDNILIMNDGFAGLSDYVEDLLIVEKKSILSGNSLITMLCGTTTKKGVELYVPVSTDLYNSIENGSIVKVRFKQLKINNMIYNTDIQVGGVVE